MVLAAIVSLFLGIVCGRWIDPSRVPGERGAIEPASPQGEIPSHRFVAHPRPHGRRNPGGTGTAGNPLHRYKWIKKASSGAFPEGCFFCARF